MTYSDEAVIVVRTKREETTVKSGKRKEQKTGKDEPRLLLVYPFFLCCHKPILHYVKTSWFFAERRLRNS